MLRCKLAFLQLRKDGASMGLSPVLHRMCQSAKGPWQCAPKVQLELQHVLQMGHGTLKVRKHHIAMLAGQRQAAPCEEVELCLGLGLAQHLLMGPHR
eukprot:4009975-Lingulodinium_polyedra.AAC.1